jgi:hypothetical protein
MSATCVITDEIERRGEASISAPRAVIAPSATSYVDEAVPSPVEGAVLLQFLRAAYGPPQTEAESAAELRSDLLKFLRDFGATAPRPVVGMTTGDYQAPRRVLLTEGTGRRRAPAALASLAAASSLRALRPAAASQVRVPPYVAELSGRGWIVSSGREVAEVAS